MQEPIVLILDDSLEGIERGVLTRTQCLERYPEHRGELAVLLDAALILRSSKLPTPNPAYFRAGRARLMAKIEQEQQLTVVDRLGHFFQHLSGNSFRLRTASVALLLAFLFVMLSGGTMFASAHALPGDTLYPLKTTIEDLRLAVATDEDESGLFEQFAERRMEEIQALLEAGRSDEVAIAVARFEDTLLEANVFLENVKPSEEAWAEQKAIHLEEQLSKHLDVLNALLEKMPDNPGLNQAIQVTLRNIARMQEHWLNKAPAGAPDDVIQGQPEDTGKPEEPGKPAELPGNNAGGFGQLADTGKPDNVGKPEKEEKVNEEKIKEEKIKEEKIKEEKDKDTPEVETEE
jgi:hypothetical protein